MRMIAPRRFVSARVDSHVGELKQCFNHKVPFAGVSQFIPDSCASGGRFLQGTFSFALGTFSFACSFHMLISFGSSQRSVPPCYLFCRRVGRTCSPWGVGAVPLTATHQGPMYSLRLALTPLALDALGPFSPHRASLAPRLSWERSLIRRGSHLARATVGAPDSGPVNSRSTPYNQLLTTLIPGQQLPTVH